MSTRKNQNKNGVIVLNASYEVLGVVKLQRAIVYVLTERADVVFADPGHVLSSSLTSMERPLVVAFREYVKVPVSKRYAEARWTRSLMLRRDNWSCAYCGEFASTVDHIVPRALGGQDSWMNTVAACLKCNGKKADKTLAQFGVPLRFQPRIVYREEVTAFAVKAVAARADPAAIQALLPSLATA